MRRRSSDPRFYTAWTAADVLADWTPAKRAYPTYGFAAGAKASPARKITANGAGLAIAIAHHDERLALNVESQIIFAGDVGSPDTSEEAP